MAGLRVDELRIELTGGGAIVEELALEVRPGEVVGLVGESGSGKTSSALALLGYHRPGVRITSASVHPGEAISYVPQDPGPALNPALRIGAAIEDVVRAHRPERLRSDVAVELLGLVGLPATAEFARRFPHQLSGGQQQRVCIALALACEPSVLVLDEPTTGLDVLTQAHLLQELARLRDERGLAMVYVTHNLAVVARIADRIMVMYAGRVVEEGPAEAVLREPRHPYTRGLLTSTPDHLQRRALQAMPGVAPGVGERPGGCAFAPRCPQRAARCEAAVPPLEPIEDARAVRCFEWPATPPIGDASPLSDEAPSPGASAPALEVVGLCAEYRARGGATAAVRDVSFVVDRGTCVALVGESGSGKSTTARVIAGLHPLAAGEIRLFGEPLPVGERRREHYRRVQLVFQNPSEALNPRHTVEYAIGRPARVLRGLRRDACAAEVRRLLELVRLPARVAGRYPAELSGGERQRVALARALAAEPDLIVCDEITSALDVSVQAAILTLLDELQRELELSLLFITHDLGTVAAIADRVLVLNAGAICEEGPTMEVLRAPRDEYTQRLLAAAPSITRPRERQRADC